MTAPDSGSGHTPDAPDVDHREGGDDAQTGQTPSAPDVDQPDGGAHAGNDD